MYRNTLASCLTVCLVICSCYCRTPQVKNVPGVHHELSSISRIFSHRTGVGKASSVRMLDAASVAQTMRFKLVYPATTNASAPQINAVKNEMMPWVIATLSRLLKVRIAPTNCLPNLHLVYFKSRPCLYCERCQFPKYQEL